MKLDNYKRALELRKEIEDIEKFLISSKVWNTYENVTLEYYSGTSHRTEHHNFILNYESAEKLIESLRNESEEELKKLEKKFESL